MSVAPERLISSLPQLEMDGIKVKRKARGDERP